MDIDELYRTKLEGKRVCLVGGSETYNYWHISRYGDIVARVGSHLHEQIKVRCDILYHSGSDPENVTKMLPNFKPSFIVTNSLKPQSIEKFEATGIPIRTICMNCHAHKERLEPFCSELGCEYAFTGFFAINDLLSFPIRQLYLTGMDLNPKNLGKHDKEKHANWIRNKIEEDKRITIDYTLERVLFGN